MRRVALLLALLPATAQAHVLDEYVQHSIVAVGRDRITVSMRLQPGVAVAGKVLAAIEHDGKPGISRAEADAYGRRVLGDLALTLDGRKAEPKLLSADVPDPAGLRQGLDEIRITYVLGAPAAPGRHTLTLENRHQKSFSAYMVNGLKPDDAGIGGFVQSRSADQTRYRLAYELKR